MKYRSLTILHLLLTCLLSCDTLMARAAEGRLYSADKMSSTSILCVTQDAYGFIWTGTDYGLNRFDGYQFDKYFHDTGDSTSILSNEITAFFVDSRQQLWIGCRKGLMRYCYENNTFLRYAFPDGLQPRVISIVENDRGEIVIGTSGYGLFVLAKGANTAVRSDRYKCKEDNNFVNALFVDNNQNLWCSDTESNLIRYVTGKTGDKGTGQSNVMSGQVASDSDSSQDAQGQNSQGDSSQEPQGKAAQSKTDSGALAPDTVRCDTLLYHSAYGPVVSFLKQDLRGFYMVCMYGILYYDTMRDTVIQTDHDLSVLDGNISIRDASFDQDGNLYLGTSGCGLMTIPKGKRTLQKANNIYSVYDLATANVNKVYEDRSGNLWVSCYKRGLLQVYKSKSTFSTWRISVQDHITGSGVISVAPAADGGVYCVMQKSGICHFDRNGKMTGMLKSPESPNALYRDNKGRYWLGTEKFLYEYFPETGNYRRVCAAEGLAVACISGDGEDHIFFGCDGKGLYIYNTRNSQLQSYTTEDDPKVNGRLCNNWIRGLYYDSRRLLWIATVNGLCCLNPATRDFRTLGWNSQFEGVKCYSLAEQPDGSMLIGTENGLYKYERETDRFGIYPSSGALREKSIYSIALDGKSDIWMSSPNGILYLNAESGETSHYVNGDGLEMSEYIVGGQIVTHDGRILFGNNDGVTSFYPRSVFSSSEKVEKPCLSRFSVNGKYRDCRSKSFHIYNHNDMVQIGFSTLDYQRQDNTTYVYRLNADDEWKEQAKGINTLSFNELAPGYYDVEVKTRIGNSLSGQACTFSIWVASPWYLSYWAWNLYFFLFMALIALCIYFYHRHEQRKLEAEKQKFLFNTTNEFHTPLSMIIEPLTKIKEITDKEGVYIDREAIAKNWQIITENTEKLVDQFNQMAEKTRMDSGKEKMHLVFKPGSIKDIEVKGNDEMLLERIVKSVNAHLTDPDFDVQVLVDEIGLSRSQLHRKMRALTGLATADFIRTVRLQQAERLIREDKINITQIALTVGFSNQSHFSTVFRRYYGKSPKQFAAEVQREKNGNSAETQAATMAKINAVLTDKVNQDADEDSRFGYTEGFKR